MSSNKYKVKLMDYDYLRNLIPCQMGCPVETDARGYVIAIGQGDYERAYMIAREPNPFASVCGRVCGAPCEIACRRGVIDEPISIRALKRFVTEQYGVEAGSLDGKPQLIPSHKAKSAGGSEDEIAFFNTSPAGSYQHHHSTVIKRFAGTEGRPDVGAKPQGKRVAIIGSGPAGLSAAHDLCLLGYRPTVFEMESVPGGEMILGIPKHRLPQDLILAEINAIVALGTEIKYNTQAGVDFWIKDLFDWGYEAVLIAIGMKESRDIPIDGLEHDGVLRAIGFLRDMCLAHPLKVGKRVIIIGGGNVAFDAARAAVRVGCVESVRLFCLESLDEMPADDIEIEDATHEGIEIVNRKGPNRVVADENGKVIGLETLDVISVFDENGRFAPKFVENSENIEPADTVIMSVGQKANFDFIKEEDGINITRRGTIEYDEKTCATSAPGVFTAGDVALGPLLIINAVAHGKLAARSIDAYLKKKTIKKRFKIRMVELKDHKMFDHFTRLKRTHVPEIEVKDRKLNIYTELGYKEETAIDEGARCLKCHVQTIYDSNKCILCAACVDICPEYCYKVVDVKDLEGDEEFDKVVEAYYKDREIGHTIIKDEERCIRCGLCSKTCPTGCITMELFNFEEELYYE